MTRTHSLKTASAAFALFALGITTLIQAGGGSSSPSFVGPLAITGGSGRYAHASGRGKLYGVLYLSDDKLTFQPVGQLRY